MTTQGSHDYIKPKNYPSKDAHNSRVTLGDLTLFSDASLQKNSGFVYE
jgi:hypothetical protein